MRWPWAKKWQAGSEWPAVIRPPVDRPITEFEAERLTRVGKWLTIHIQVTSHGSWVNWKHDIPEELRVEAKDALIALALALQDK